MPLPGGVCSRTQSAWASPTASARVSQAPLRLQGLTSLTCCHACFFHWAPDGGQGPVRFTLLSPALVSCLTWEMLNSFWLTEYIVSAGAHVRVACTHLPSTASSWLLGQLKSREQNNHLRSLYRAWGHRKERIPVSARCMKQGTFVTLCLEFGFYIFNTDCSVLSTQGKVQLDFHTFSTVSHCTAFLLPMLRLSKYWQSFKEQPQVPFQTLLSVLFFFFFFPILPLVITMPIDTRWSSSGVLLTGPKTLGWWLNLFDSMLVKWIDNALTFL